MRLLLISESPLECVNGRYYALDPWARFIVHLAATEERIVLFTPVIDRATPSPDRWLLEPGRLVIERQDYYTSYVSFVRLWVTRRRAWRRRFVALMKTVDAVAIRLPSPSLGLTMSAAREARIPVALLVAGDTLTQSDRIIASRGLKRLMYRVIVAAFVHQEVRAGREAGIVFAYSSELAARHPDAIVRPMRTPLLRAADFSERTDTCARPEIRLIRVSWLIPSKGIEPLLDAVAALHRRGVRVRLSLLGKERAPGYQKHLEERVRRLGIESIVEFHGWIAYDRTPGFFDDADIQVISSLAEGTPRCILDGMARGVPLVCTRVGGCGDYLEDARTALLVPPADPGALADAIERVATDGELRRRLIAGGYELARTATFEALAPAILAEIGAAVERNRRRLGERQPQHA